MAYQEVLQYINRMNYTVATEGFHGLDKFKIGQLAFDLDVPIDDDMAAGLFKKLSQVCRVVPPEEAASAAIFAAGYLVNAKVGFRIYHPWDYRMTLKCNLLAIRNARSLNRHSRRMRKQVENEPALKYLPVLDVAILLPAVKRKRTA